jgi:dTDP-glucose 4,6-dehydratase
MKLLVTGGAGFIGSNFIHYIINQHPDYKIINLDKLTYAGNLDNLKDLQKNPNYQFVRGDICDVSLVKQLVPGVDVILNFAAESHVDRSIASPDEFIKTNVFGTNTLLRAALEAGQKKFIQISTDEVYGSIKAGSFSEKDALNPSSPYSASKASGDLIALAYFKTYQLPVIITRSSNNFGPYQYPEKLIPLMIANALEEKPLPIYGDGKNIRDWLYVEDNCEAIDIILHKGKAGEIYNIGAGYEVENIKLVKEVLRILGKSERLISFVRDRPGHDYRYSIDSSKIRKLGWEPRHQLKDALEKTVNWYQENEWWWKPLKRP